MEDVQFRDAQDLFTNLAVDHVALVLRSTREQVDHKRSELRHLISERYHDLIDSADAIVGMDRTVDEFKQLVSDIERDARQLLESPALLDPAADEPVPANDRSLVSQPSADSIGVDGASGFGGPQPQLPSDATLLQQAERAEQLTHAAVNIWESIDSKDLWQACAVFLRANQAFDDLQRFATQQVHAEPAEHDVSTTGPNANPACASALARLGAEPVASERLLRTVAGHRHTERKRTRAGSHSAQNIWELYPYLRSHWSLVKQARGKILFEAGQILQSQELELAATIGSIRALLALGDASSEESVTRLLDARSALLSDMLQHERKPTTSSSGTTDEIAEYSDNALGSDSGDGPRPASVGADRLVQALIVIMRTLADVAHVFVLHQESLGDAAPVDTAVIQEKASAWLAAQQPLVSEATRATLARVGSASDLVGLLTKLVEIEASGGAAADAASDMDLALWKQTCEVCVSPEQRSAGPAGALILLSRFYLGPFLERAAELLGATFRVACEELADDLDAVLAALASEPETLAWAPATESATERQDDPNVVTGSDRFARKLAGRVMAEDAVGRAQAATALVFNFNTSVVRLGARKAELVKCVKAVSPSAEPAFVSALAPLCLAAMDDLAARLATALSATSYRFEQGVQAMLEAESGSKPEPASSSPSNDGVATAVAAVPDANQLVEVLKHALFVTRAAQALSASRSQLESVLAQEQWAPPMQRLSEMSDQAHHMFADLSLQLTKGVLLGSLDHKDRLSSKEAWPHLHSGWERIAISLLDEGGVEDEPSGADDPADADADGGDDFVVLPGTVSPGVAVFSFLLSKQIRTMGDSRFISSPSALEDHVLELVSDFPGQLLGDSRAEWVDQLLDACVSAFCNASRDAILELADKSVSFVVETYQNYLGNESNPPNEAAALQVIFDLHWFDWLLFVPDRPKVNPLQNLIDELAESGHIDVVDWTLYAPLLVSRVKTYRERNTLLFGPMLMVKAHFEAQKSTKSAAPFASGGVEGASAYDSNNLLHLGYLANSTASRIPLLPIPSTLRSLHQKRAALQRQHSSSSSSRTLLTATNARATARAANSSQDESASALKVMGQVGSNLFSQASSWLNTATAK